MKTSTLGLLSVGAASAAAQTSLLAQFADSFIRRGVEYDFGYTAATLYLGYEAAYDLTKNQTLYDWYHDQIDGVVADDGTIIDWNYTFYSLDEYVSTAIPFLTYKICQGRFSSQEMQLVKKEQMLTTRSAWETTTSTGTMRLARKSTSLPLKLYEIS